MTLRNTILLTLLLLLTSLSSCDSRRGYTVESAYTEVVWAEPVYKFSRNNRSSINTHEVDKLHEAVKRIDNGYLRKPDFQFPYRAKELQRIYEEGMQSASIKQMISSSPLHSPQRRAVQADLEALFKSVAHEGGQNTANQMWLLRREATVGQSGYVGIDVGDNNAVYVDAKGVNFAAYYRYFMVGALYLDQILNTHLQPELYNDAEARLAHEVSQLVPGGNYTQFEYHWDQAYAYYKHIKFITDASGTLTLRESHRKIFYAFVQGRIALSINDYADLHQQLTIIRSELSRATAAQAILRLQGPNTMANLHYDHRYAFTLLSEAYGLLYSLQFTVDAEGNPAYTYQQVQALQAQLMEGNGFWEKARFLEQGALHNLATQVAEKFALNLRGL